MQNRIPKGKVVLERALSKLGIASRAQARALVQEGKVGVNGKPCKNPQFAVSPEKDKITVEGKTVKKAARSVLMLNKPAGLITTRSDENGRATVFSLIPQSEGHLNAIGRLDQATTGLLLLTNDTRLADWLTDPKNKVPRTYLVTVRGEFNEDKVLKLKRGIQDAGETLSADDIEIRKLSGRESHLTVRLLEGKNREIRRMFSALGHEVTRLKRVSFGDLSLGDLELGKFRKISENELEVAFKCPKQRI